MRLLMRFGSAQRLSKMVQDEPFRLYNYPAIKHLYNICITPAQRLRRSSHPDTTENNLVMFTSHRLSAIAPNKT